MATLFTGTSKNGNLRDDDSVDRGDDDVDDSVDHGDDDDDDDDDDKRASTMTQATK